MDMNELQVSKNIKSCREKIGKTPENMAEALGIPKLAYIEIENNPFSCNINKLNDIAKVIDCNINNFFKQSFSQSEISVKSVELGYNTKRGDKQKCKN